MVPRQLTADCPAGEDHSVQRYQVAALSKVGGREHNEDRSDWCTLADGSGCWVVADGLGGQGAGEVASTIAVQAVLDDYQRDPAVTPGSVGKHLSHANQAVLEAQAHTPGGRRMASTGVVLCLGPQGATCAHVGDSRLYRFREGQWTLLTTDHSMAQLLVRTGEITPEAARASPERNNLLRSLGSDECRIDVAELDPARAGDVFLLCSDGLWEYVTEDAMSELLVASAGLDNWLAVMEERLLRRVGELGMQDRHDNYTALAVCVLETPRMDTLDLDQTGQVSGDAPVPRAKARVHSWTLVGLVGLVVLIAAGGLALWLVSEWSSSSSERQDAAAPLVPESAEVDTMQPRTADSGQSAQGSIVPGSESPLPILRMISVPGGRFAGGCPPQGHACPNDQHDSDLVQV